MEKFFDHVLRVILAEKDRRGSFAKLCKPLGLNPTTIQKWYTDTTADGKPRSPGLADVGKILDSMGVTLSVPYEDDPDHPIFDYDFLPKVSAKAGAGASLEVDADIKGFYAFRKEFIGIEGIHPAGAVLMDVVGDSMEPTLSSGDTILIDQSDKTVIEGKVYVVTLGEELRVKRLYKGITGLVLRSDNQAYPDINVSSVDMEQLIIHGRVRWVGRIM